MKLLLTSAGLTNKSIIQALEKLISPESNDRRIAFIPTAANVEEGSKDWLIEDLNNCQNAGFEIDIVDISAVPQKIWQPRLEASQVLLFGGGNSMHLMRWIKESGLQEILPELLKTRVYMGISAGSCVTGPTIDNSVQGLLEEVYEQQITEGLGFVPFQFIPHLNSPFFESIREEKLRTAAQGVSEPVYALDDNSAIVIDNDILEVISEGEWHRFNA